MKEIVRAAKAVTAAWVLLMLASAGVVVYLWNGQRQDLLTFEQAMQAMKGQHSVSAASRALDLCWLAIEQAQTINDPVVRYRLAVIREKLR